MPRVARLVIPNCPHHITQRGNNRQDVFFVDDDRRAYLEFLRERCETYGRPDSRLLPDGQSRDTSSPSRTTKTPSRKPSAAHTSPTRNTSIGCTAAAATCGRTASTPARWTKPICGRRWRTWSETRSGLGWCGRRGGTRGPVRRAHVGDRADATGLLDSGAWLREWKAERWRAMLREPTDESFANRLLRQTHTGRPLATDSWLSKIERALGRRLRPLPVGRPRTRTGQTAGKRTRGKTRK